MKSAFTLSLILALVGVPGLSGAAERDTAQMMAFCREPVGTPSRTYCHGFFWGVFRVLTDEWIEGGYPGLGVCPHDSFSNAQMARIFLLFAEAHPEMQNLEPQRVAAQAFAKAFPCPK